MGHKKVERHVLPTFEEWGGVDEPAPEPTPSQLLARKRWWVVDQPELVMDSTINQ